MILLMAGEKLPSSPEKELLKLIEKPMSKDALRSAAVRYHGKSFFSFGALKGRIAFLQNKLKSFKTGDLRTFDLKAFNMILSVSVVILLGYFIISSAFAWSNLQRDIVIDIKSSKHGVSNPTQMSSLLKAASFYLEKARARDIFSMNLRSPTIETGMFVKGPSQRFLELTQNLRLVGISWSDDPDVLIEDTKSQRTLFLKKGQLIDNAIKVQAVFKDHVVLSYGSEETELR